MTKIVVCGICADAECTIHFLKAILNLQLDMCKHPHLNICFEMFTTTNEALNYFYKDISNEWLVCIGSSCSVDTDFIFHVDPDKDFVIASYPRTTIDWQKVQKRIDAGVDDLTAEQLSDVGLQYNFDPSRCTPVPLGSRFVQIDKRGVNQLKVFKISRRVVSDMLERHPTLKAADDSFVLWADGIEDGRRITADERFCHLWNKTIFCDVLSRTSNTGKFDFIGCVKDRVQLR
jgi:hypothetical protein